MSQLDTGRDMLGHTREVLPASQYLQERLQERRARNTRPKRSRHTDFGPQKGRDDDIFLNEADDTRRMRMYDSSPLGAASVRSSESGSNNRRRALGVRDMDNQLDRLSKQNFALKLELDHRREQTKKLQEQIESMRAQVERAELLEDEHKELLRINSQMVDELERRDKAVEEAMDIICELEERVADTEERHSHTRPSTANADSGYAGTETQENELSSSPPQLQSKLPEVNVNPPPEPASAASQRLQGVIQGQTPVKTRREPNILSQKRPSTNALRSVYLASARELRPVKSFQSLLSKKEARTDDDDGLSSPRLSVLSESSFPSIYSPKPQVSPDKFAWEDGDDERDGSQSRPRSHMRQDSIKRVSQWISERDELEMTPSKSNNVSAPLANNEDVAAALPAMHHGNSGSYYQSLNDALVSAAGRSSGLPQELEAFNPFETRTRKQRSTQSRPTSFAGPIFGEPLLPPTPDSASTRMLRASRSSIADDRSLVDVMPAPFQRQNTLQVPGEPGVRTAPRQMRSSVELRTALASNMEFRNQVLDGLHETESYVHHEDAVEEGRYHDYEGFKFEDDDVPDGKSIHMGTPRRLLKRAKAPVSNQSNAGYQVDHRVDIPQSPPRRRRSSDHYMSPAKPRLSRIETSPIGYESPGGVAVSIKIPSGARMTSPHSVHSNSSGNRTVVQVEDTQRRAMSPEGLTAMPQRELVLTSPIRSRTSPSPARTLSQKTATLFRRLSNSHGSDREKGPPVVLAGGIPEPTSETKRPRTSHGNERPPTSSGVAQAVRPPSSRGDTRRPSLQMRTRTEPATGRPPSSSADGSFQGSEKDKKSFFKRTNGAKTSDGGIDMDPRHAPTKRRGSLRDAVTTARRPWR